MDWESKAAEDYACFELSLPPLKINVVARHKIANWIVFYEASQTDGVRSLFPVKPVVWGECDDSVQAREEAETAMSVISGARKSVGMPESDLFWPESTTGIIYEGGDRDKFLVPGGIAAQRLLQPWGLRPYYEGTGGPGRLVLINAGWAPLARVERKSDNAIVWTGNVRDPLAANEMALGLAELFGRTAPAVYGAGRQAMLAHKSNGAGTQQSRLARRLSVWATAAWKSPVMP